jgi:putative salt-induced outer membrane protein YdiY
MNYEIEKDGKILARYISASEAWGNDNLSFFSEDKEYIQAGSWNYSKGKKLLAHTHNEVERSVLFTQEVIFIKSGSLRAYIYDDDSNLVEEFTAYKDDILIMLSGGHGYEVLEDDTKVLEIKNGPYLGAEVDRDRLNLDG